MICKSCNREIPDDSKYCHFCGKEQLSQVSNPTIQGGYERSIGKVLLLGIVTIGIYWIYWFHTMNNQIKEHSKTDIRPSLRTLLYFFTVNTIGWYIGIIPVVLVGPLIGKRLSFIEVIPLFWFLFMIGFGSYVLSLSIKDIQSIYQEDGKAAAFKHPIGYAIAAILVPFVFVFLIARIQSELNRHWKLHQLSPEEVARGEKLSILRPQRLPVSTFIAAIFVPGILGLSILSAIAIPGYLGYRAKACNVAAQNDLNNAYAVAQQIFRENSEAVISLPQRGRLDGF